MTAFLDTNILIDYLADRKPFSTEAAKLIDQAYRKNLNICISAVSFNNIYYILRQSCSHTETIQVLTEMQEWVQTIGVSGEIIKKSLASGFKDFEDAIQYYCAKSAGKVDFIVTRDVKGFKSASLAILTPREALAVLQGN